MVDLFAVAPKKMPRMAGQGRKGLEFENKVKETLDDQGALQYQVARAKKEAWAAKTVELDYRIKLNEYVNREVFARRRFRRLEDGLAVPMQVQLIEAEFVPMLDSDAWPGMPQGNRIRSGIELDKIGRRIAYWMYREHPGDGASTITANMLVRVPASEIRHIMEQKRPGQLRGVPALAPVLARLRNINDYDDAVLERQKLANLFVAFLTRTMPGAESDIDIDPLTNLPIEWGSNGEPLAGMHPGMTQELDPGQDVKFANPPEAGTTYSDYMRTAHMGTAAAAGTSQTRWGKWGARSSTRSPRSNKCAVA